MKKVKIALLLTAVLLLSLSGCRRGSGSRAESEDGHFDISIALWEINTSLPRNADDPLRKIIEDKFNITLTGAGLSWADDVPQQLALWAATGQLPDVFGGDLCWSAQFRQWVSDGVIRSIPESMYRKYPNISNVVRSDAAVQSLMINGELWFLPRMTFPDVNLWNMERGILNRKDWRIKLGFDVPRTKQDFIDLCVAYATMNPKGDGSYTVGMSFDTPGFIFDQTFPSFGQTGYGWIRGDDGMYRLPMWEDDVFELVSWIRDLNRAGGLDPDFLNYSQNATESGMSGLISGKIGMLGLQVSPFRYQMIHTGFSAANSGVRFEDMLDYFEILDPPVDTGNTPVSFITAGYWSENYINDNVSDAKLDRILELINYLMSDEGMLMMNLGIEGTDWDRDTAGNFTIHNEFPTGTYPILSGGFQYFGIWTEGFTWVTPAIPQSIRDYCRENFDYRVKNWTPMKRDYALALETIPERDALGDALGYLMPFIFDRSNTSNRDLFNRMKSDADAGYRSAKDAVNSRARSLGVIN